MTDNIRTELYGAPYEGVVANKMNEPRNEIVTVCGRCCESGDIVIYDIPIAHPERGDIFAVYSTGGYNYSMASNYNRLPKPAIVMLRGGNENYIAVKAQTFEDLVRNEL